jgi:UDP-N-acetylglucosamine diphosphorylase / glucose-1-phosphate thymidylyltransferase / UDP-N-acetylgalactosamine diphosphorylase / glucosamine-1-phosphate N-acetyltransferase / galactosamine-1-phosphate N-acetyltransferase
VKEQNPHQKPVFAPEDFFDLDHTEHRVIFDHVEDVWQALPKITAYLQFRLKPGIFGKLIGKPFVSNAVFVGAGTVIEHGAMIKGPAWIGENCEIRNGCYIRENVILGNGVVAGNSSEFKNCLVFDNAQIPHFNYVGDSILGFRAHLGAGVILSNVKLNKTEVTIPTAAGVVSTGLKKFGAIVGDHAEIGCNSVLSPGSLIGKNAIVYPGSQWRGVLPSDHVAKFRQEFSVIERRRIS